MNENYKADDENTFITNPNRGLVSAVILRAINDYLGYEEKELVHKDAYQWLFVSRDKGKYSFLWCCNHLSLDIDAMRKQIKKYSEFELHVASNSQLTLEQLAEKVKQGLGKGGQSNAQSCRTSEMSSM